MDLVLIVDDSTMLINYIEDSFEKYRDKFECIFANDGLEAISIFKNRPVSLLVTDLQMPNLDGLGLLAYVNKNHPNIPCIVMSAHGTPKIIKTLRSDILQFIEKPFKAEQLAEAIIPALRRGKTEGSLSGISTASFLQMIEMELKTCLCEVLSTDNRKGLFYFKRGKLYQAFYGGLKGDKAAIKMIQIENPTINFIPPPDRKIPRRIDTSLTKLLMEAMRQKDEDGD